MAHRISTVAALGCAITSIAAGSSLAEPTAPNLPAALDPDHNGLYDDGERLALVQALAALSPRISQPIDPDGDGKITYAQQSAGDHPLSMLITREQLAASATQIPWGIDVFPEWITTAYFQEDAPFGEVDQHPTRGTIPSDATQAEADHRPRLAGRGQGVAFAENSGQHLDLPGQRYAHWNYRWCLLTFRIDGQSGRADQTQLLDINHGDGPNLSTPRIWYDHDAGLHVQYVGRQRDGADRRVLVGDHVIADGQTWNVLVCGTRFGQVYASLNGVELTATRPQPPRFAGDLIGNDTRSFLGDPDASSNAAWAYDALVFGLTEPTEAMVRKLTGWAAHRLDFADRLPQDHPYHDRRPVLDREDLPKRYVHDDERWTRWGQSLTAENTRGNSGGTRVEPRGFERVFYDDFRADRIDESYSGSGDLWQAPGFNTAVGIDAQLGSPHRQPDVYRHSRQRRLQQLALEQHRDRWYGSAFYSINDMGHGYTWSGPKVFRIRFQLPPLEKQDIAGQFPAFWSYDPDFLFWRTANRIEVDWLELEGHATDWLNGIPSHIHYVHLKNPYVKNQERYKSYKVYGQHMTPQVTNLPDGFNPWDGKFHTWEFVVDHDTTYANITIYDRDGNERWVELFRGPTAEIYLRPLDLQLDYALKGKQHGEPGSGKTQQMLVDWIEVLQKTDQLAELPEAFRERPTLRGSVQAGQTVTCEPHLPGIRDVRYFWFADGYPLTWGPDATLKIGPEHEGKAIRCMVKAVGALDQPEAWTDVLQ